MPHIDDNLAEVEIKLGEMTVEKQKITSELSALQAQLTEVNTKCSVRLPNKEFQRLQSRRGDIIKQKADKENELRDWKARMAVLQTKKSLALSQSMTMTDIKSLAALRDKWHDFSMDKINHQKGREVAWKFSQELGEILKRYFQS